MTQKQRLDKHDKEIAAIRKLVRIGMGMLVRGQEAQQELRASQKKTDKMLQDLIKSLKGGGTGTNGHDKKPRNPAIE